MGNRRMNYIKNDDTIVKLIKGLADEKPDKEAFVFYDKDMTRTAMTRGEVWDKSTRFAAVLHRMGIGKGDIVCNTLVNSRERLISTFGTIVAGASSMHGQVLLADGEDIMKNWKDSQCKAIIVDPTEKKGAPYFLKKIEYNDECTGETRYKDLPHLSHVIPIVLGNSHSKTKSWLQKLEDESDTYQDDTMTFNSVAFIFTTSGSTGFGKLVAHTHGTCLHAARIAAGFFGINSQSIYFNHRSFGWIGGVPILQIVTGTLRIVVDYSLGNPRNAGKFMIDLFNAEKVNTAFLVPSDIQLTLDALNAGNNLNDQFERMVTGGGPLSTASMEAIGKLTEVVYVSYGSTEAAMVNAYKVCDANSYQNCCVGYPADGVEIKILAEDGNEVSMGETGEVFVRSSTIAKCYLNQPEKSEKAFLKDGWFRTSDVGHVNEKGQMFVYCRKANAINHKGFLHYPGWMEARINKHPEVQKSIMIGIPHPINHEDLCLCVIKEPGSNLTEDVLREHCKSLFVSNEKDAITPIPKYYLFFDAFPLNSNGKFDRNNLRPEVIKRIEYN